MAVKYVTSLVVALAATQVFVTNQNRRMLAPADALRMINLDVPQMAIQGDTIQLSCSYMLAADGDGRQSAAAITRYDLDDESGGASRAGGSNRSTGRGSVIAIDNRLIRRSPEDEPSYRLAQDSRQPEMLYAIKWYKDEREFFRYVSQDWPHKQVLPIESLNIDVDKSDNQTVVLRNVSLKTSGLFRCEVSTDAPSFLTKSIERKVLIYSLPTEGPTIEPASRLARQIQYRGDQLEYTCLSRESKPRAQLDWILNERINLTSAMPRNSQGGPVFQVASERLVRLPSASVRAGQVNTQEGGLGFPSPRASYTTFAFEPSGENSGAKLVAKSTTTNSSAPQTVSLSVDTLDQLAEITVSKLNFTVDANLIRLISESPGGGEQARRATDLNWRTRKVNLQAAGQTRKYPLYTEESVGERSKLTLRIRCVARVLHLKMSDDIKVIITNRTRASPEASNGLAMSSLHTRGNDEANSAQRLGREDNLRCWLIVVMFVLIASRDLRMVSNVLLSHDESRQKAPR